MLASCGDGFVQTGREQCDGGPGCDNKCCSESLTSYSPPWYARLLPFLAQSTAPAVPEQCRVDACCLLSSLPSQSACYKIKYSSIALNCSGPNYQSYNGPVNSGSPPYTTSYDGDLAVQGCIGACARPGFCCNPSAERCVSVGQIKVGSPANCTGFNNMYRAAIPFSDKDSCEAQCPKKSRAWLCTRSPTDGPRCDYAEKPLDDSLPATWLPPNEPWFFGGYFPTITSARAEQGCLDFCAVEQSCCQPFGNGGGTNPPRWLSGEEAAWKITSLPVNPCTGGIMNTTGAACDEKKWLYDSDRNRCDVVYPIRQIPGQSSAESKEACERKVVMTVYCGHDNSCHTATAGDWEDDVWGFGTPPNIYDTEVLSGGDAVTGLSKERRDQALLRCQQRKLSTGSCAR